jgi:hypothetical protein
MPTDPTCCSCAYSIAATNHQPHSATENDTEQWVEEDGSDLESD